jgi:hypothetical protein
MTGHVARVVGKSQGNASLRRLYRERILIQAGIEGIIWINLAEGRTQCKYGSKLLDGIKGGEFLNYQSEH